MPAGDARPQLRQQKPRQVRIRLPKARWRAGVTAKDLALHIIGKLGAAAGVGIADRIRRVRRSRRW